MDSMVYVQGNHLKNTNSVTKCDINPKEGQSNSVDERDVPLVGCWSSPWWIRRTTGEREGKQCLLVSLAIAIQSIPILEEWGTRI